MIPSTEGALPAGEPIPVQWTVPPKRGSRAFSAFVRPMARTGSRDCPRAGGVEVDEKILDAARDFFGM